MFNESELKSIRDAMTFCIAGVLLYPAVIYLMYIFYPTLLSLFGGDYSHSDLFRYISMIVPFFSFLILFSAFKLSSVKLDYIGENFLRYFYRIFAFIYASLAIAIAITAFQNQLEIGYFINNFKTTVWRLGSVFCFIYIILIFFKMGESEWGYISIGVMFVSLSQDIYFYLTKIRRIVNPEQDNTIDKTLLLLSLIVFVSCIIVLFRLRLQATRNLKLIKTRSFF